LILRPLKREISVIFSPAINIIFLARELVDNFVIFLIQIVCIANRFVRYTANRRARSIVIGTNMKIRIVGWFIAIPTITKKHSTEACKTKTLGALMTGFRELIKCP
jgi:hypothetical protein